MTDPKKTPAELIAEQEKEGYTKEDTPEQNVIEEEANDHDVNIDIEKDIENENNLVKR